MCLFMTKRSKQCPEDNKDKYSSIIDNVLSNNNCHKCKWKIIQSWRWSFKCIDCNGRSEMKNKYTELFKDMTNSSNWKSTCEECWWKMNYYSWRGGWAYICTKCANVLEV